jgi:uncharacterized protein YqhQ
MATIGGQAVLEGVMMRGVSTWAVAVRRPDGEVEISSEPIKPWAQRHRIWRLPVLRGIVALGESLKIGFRALAISANASFAFALRRSQSHGMSIRRMRSTSGRLPICQT